MISWTKYMDLWETPEIISELQKNKIRELRLNNAVTISNAFPGKTILTGDVIDHFGKCANWDWDLPWFAAADWYFAYFIRSFSTQTLEAISEQLHEFKRTGVKKSAFDLYSQEQLIGQNSAITCSRYDTLGLDALCIYNCRELLELFYKLPMLDRRKRLLNKKMFSLIDPVYLDCQFFNEMGNKVPYKTHTVKEKFDAYIFTHNQYIEQRDKFTR